MYRAVSVTCVSLSLTPQSLSAHATLTRQAHVRDAAWPSGALFALRFLLTYLLVSTVSVTMSP